MFFGILTQPESPRWLIGAHQGKDKARETLVKLRGSEEAADAEIKEIEESVAKEEAETEPLRLKNLFAPRLRMLFIIGVLLVFFQNWGGINTIIYYAPTLLKNVGFSDTQSILANAAIGLLNMLMTLPAMKLIDKAGRRPLLIIGAGGMCAGMLFLGLTTLFGLAKGHTGGAITVTLIGIAVYIASFAISWGPVQWVMLPELFPFRIRAGAMGICTTLNWLFNLAVALLFPSLLAKFGAGPNFLFFAVTTFLALIFAWRLLPETKGKSLEEIEQQLSVKTEPEPATAG